MSKVISITEDAFHALLNILLYNHGVKLSSSNPNGTTHDFETHGVKGHLSFDQNSNSLTVHIFQHAFYLPIEFIFHSIELLVEKILASMNPPTETTNQTTSSVPKSAINELKSL